jgi:hypothetical protein
MLEHILIYISMQQRSPDEQAGVAYARMLEQGRALAETLQACTLRPHATSTLSPHATSTLSPHATRTISPHTERRRRRCRRVP